MFNISFNKDITINNSNRKKRTLNSNQKFNLINFDKKNKSRDNIIGNNIIENQQKNNTPRTIRK